MATRRQKLKARLLALTSVTLGLTLAACGGGSSGASVSPGSTQPPPPPPPPPPSNSSLANLQYDETFDAASAVMSHDINLAGAGENQVFASGNVSSTTTVAYDASTDSFTLSISQSDVNYSQTFRPVDIDNSDVDFTTYIRSGDLAILLNPNAPLLALEYVTLGAWVSESGSSQRDLSLGYLAGGIQTPDGDMPVTGTANYTGEITGTGVAKPTGLLYYLSGDADIEADFSTGDVTTTITVLRNLYADNTGLAPYLFESNGSISGATNLFGGTISSLDGSNLSGRVDGAFFGPNADEVGGTFSASNSNDDMVGAFVAGPAAP